jgi:hypothetical protein
MPGDINGPTGNIGKKTAGGHVGHIIRDSPNGSVKIIFLSDYSGMTLIPMKIYADIA